MNAPSQDPSSRGSTPEPGPAPAPRERFLDRAEAAAMLLPAALLAWPGPGAPLAHDFVPHLTGAGVLALATLPAALLLLARGRPARARGILLAFLALVLAWARADGGDTLAASRALCFAASGLVLVLAGASLGAAGRRVFARGAVLVSLLLLVTAHQDGGNAFAGALGNTGNVSQSALAGALLGGFLFAIERGPWRALGALALAASIAYSVRVPVLAGAASAAAGLGAWALAARVAARRERIAFAALALLVVLASGARVAASRAASAPQSFAPAGAPVDAAPLALAPGDTGGIAVRASLARGSAKLLAEHPWLGVGPGQFALAYPEAREPAEIERSTHGRALGAETEVEHPHDDWLLFLVEGGLVGGSLVIAFLLWVAAAACRRLGTKHGGEDARVTAACAAAALALLANALAHAPLSHDATAASLAAGLFGIVVAAPGSGRARGRLVAALAVLPLVALAPRAGALVTHGRALAGLAAPELATREADAVTRALASAPDSVLARTLAARGLAADGAPREQVEAAWEAVLALRPHRVEAWIQLGVLTARAGDTRRARACFERAVRLDPGHPGLLRNLASLAFEEGRTDEGYDWLARLGPGRQPGDDWLQALGCELYLRGRESAAEALLARIDAALLPASPELALARSQEEAARGRRRIADMLEARAQRGWAREHAEAGRFADAVRLYRQELRISRSHVAGGARNVRLELAAALFAAGRESDAREVLAELGPEPADRPGLPAWASERLERTGWLPDTM